jgi:hypothetical protein
MLAGRSYSRLMVSSCRKQLWDLDNLVLVIEAHEGGRPSALIAELALNNMRS